MTSANFNGVVDTANKLFEHILRTEFETKFSNQYMEKWPDFTKSGKIPYERANLGHLAAVAREVGIIEQGSFSDYLLLAFSRMRVPQKHDTPDPTISQVDAATAIDLVESFVRHWYRAG
jgi:hypothetical protein